MAQITLRGEELEFDDPVLVEGLPGVGLVGKIATDHLIDEFEMTYYASIHCEGIPRIGLYFEGDDEVRPPVRLYVDPERELFALRSEVPISRTGSREFAHCVSGWIEAHDVTPIYLSGRPTENSDEAPSLFGVTTGSAGHLLEGHNVDRPSETGVIGGPTGALLNRAAEIDLESVGLVVESDPQFPDPEAARVLIDRGIGPITGIDVNTDSLVEHAEEIREQRELLARRMREAEEDESTQAQPLRMYQ